MARVVDMIFERRSKNLVIASEVAYSNNLRRIDLIALSEELEAFEIKGPRDNLSRLKDQIKDIYKHFDKAWVVCAHEVVEKLPNLASKNVGIITFDSGFHLSLYRDAISVRPTKRALLDLLRGNEVTDLAKKHGVKPSRKRRDVETLKGKLEKLITKELLYAEIMGALKWRYESRFRYFLTHKSPKTSADDIYYLKISPSDWLDF